MHRTPEPWQHEQDALLKIKHTTSEVRNVFCGVVKRKRKKKSAKRLLWCGKKKEKKEKEEKRRKKKEKKGGGRGEPVCKTDLEQFLLPPPPPPPPISPELENFILQNCSLGSVKNLSNNLSLRSYW